MSPWTAEDEARDRYIATTQHLAGVASALVDSALDGLDLTQAGAVPMRALYEAAKADHEAARVAYLGEAWS